jgi:hypothetical protein
MIKNYRDLPAGGDLDWPRDYTPLLDSIYAKLPMQWLRKYGITDEEIKRWNIGWSLERVLLMFPVMSTTNSIIMWQGRNFGEGTKYVTYGPKESTLHLVGKPQRGIIVVTEDVVSAIKVGREYQAAPLWGSSMSLGLIKKIADQFEVLGIWLDSDKVTEAVKIALRASQYIPTFVVDSGLDPKAYSNNFIHDFVENAANRRLDKDNLVVIKKDTVPDDDESLLTKAQQNWRQTMNNIVANQPCTKCSVKSSAVKSVCVVPGCPYFDPNNCDQGKACHKRQCEGCLSEYGDVCLNETEKTVERRWDQYPKSNSGS